MVKVLDEIKQVRDRGRMPVVRPLAPDLWVIDHPFRMPGGIALGARTTVVRLRDDKLWVHSPGPLIPEVRAWLVDHGPVGFLVAPNLLHHLFLREAVDAFPGVPVFGPAGLSAKTDVPMQLLDTDTPPWQADLDTVRVSGCPRMDEFVFFHAATRTLVLTDLAFNFRGAESFATRVFLRLNGALGSFGPSRLARRVFLGDRVQVKRAIDRILAWDFDRVVVSHGDVLEAGGPEALRTGYAWLSG